MPLYDFKNNDTGEVEEHSMSYKDVEQFLIDNPHLEKMISSPNLISNTGTIPVSYTHLTLPTILLV